MEGHLKPRERLQGDRGDLRQVWKTQKEGGAEGAEAEKDGQRYRKKREIQREGKKGTEKGSETQGERERDPGGQGENRCRDSTRREDRTETQRQGTETQERGHRCKDPER